MESYSDSYLHQQVNILLKRGDFHKARGLVYHWLDCWAKNQHSSFSPSSLRNPELWKSLADVVEQTHDSYLVERFWQSLDCIYPPISGPLSIPLLGIPIVNRFDLLLKLIDSLDYPIDTLAIVDNSCDVSDQPKFRIELEKLQNSSYPLINRIEIAKPFRNLGVAASWNLILTSFPGACWALIANNDIQFAPGILGAAASRIEPSRPQFLSLFPEPQSFSAFLITAKTWDQIGLFDVNFYPAYCEDLDYRDRLRSDPSIEIHEIGELQNAMASLNRHHSATIESDPQLAERNRSSFQLNRLWYFSQRRLRNDPRGSWVRRWLASWDH